MWRYTFPQLRTVRTGSRMCEDSKIEGLNDRISRKPQSPCSSKASNGIQQSQSIDCHETLFEPGR